jgi:hypothetical protein
VHIGPAAERANTDAEAQRVVHSTDDEAGCFRCFFAANYQPTTTRVPPKSSLADPAGERRNSQLVAVPRLFSAVSGVGADRVGDPTGSGSRRATFSISHPTTIS